MEHLPTLRQLQYLSAVAESGSFTAAAAQCHVTQSTLSAGIAALESLLNQPVIDRSQRQAALTPLGAAVLERGRGMLADAAAIVALAQQHRAPLAGPLRLGIIPTIAPYLLPRILPVLRARFPDMALQIHEDLSARLVEDLRAGRLDLLLLAFPYDTPGMVQRVLYTEDFVLACPRGAWPKKGVTLDDLRGRNDLLLLEEGHCLRDHALAACALPEPAAGPFSATSLPTLIQMVRHGYGVTLLPAMAAVDTQLFDDIDIIRFLEPPPHRQAGLVWRRGSPRQDGLVLLAEALEASLRD